MANRRMFSKTITNSSKFLMMPPSAQNLYFHLGMNADDDGFCEHFTIMRMTESKPDDLKILQAKGFIKIFDDKVLIITQWKENNYIRSDRYTPSKYLKIYKEELKQLSSGQEKADKEKTNKEKPKWLKSREKARKDGDLPFSFDYKIKKSFWGRRCIICGEVMGSNSINKPSIQHNIPFSKGGKHTIDNISVICESCNEKNKGRVLDKTNSDEVKRVWDEIKKKDDGIQSVTRMDTQVRLGKVRLGKVRVRERIEKKSNSPSLLPQKTKKFIIKVKKDLEGISISRNQIEEIKKFVAYWTEPNKSQTKIRWELEKTWDTKRRFASWMRNCEKFGNKNKYKIEML